MFNNLNTTSVEIVLPNYNSAPYLEETINSILNQTYTNWKLTITDAYSNLETKKILKKYADHPKINIIWLKKNKKAGFCRNLIIRNSKAEYLAFIDSDDIWEKNKLFKQMNFMIKNKYYFTYTNYQPFQDSQKENQYKEICPEEIFTYNKFIKNTSIATSTMIVKNSLVRDIKFSNTKICEDYYFKCQILQKIKYAYCLKENLMKYRIRKNSLQSNKIRNIYWIWYINKKYNKMILYKNLISIIGISFNSIKKYGFK